MSGSKHFDRIAVIITALTLVLTVLFMNGAALGIEVAVQTVGYENRLFDNTKVHTVDIVMNDWESFIENAMSEEYSAANVIIDGESYKNVGIRAKGNTSLSTVSSLGSERYSFKIEFDKYNKSESYHGLDKLSLNNLIQDSTMMKDYLVYTLMNKFDVNSSLCSYVYITVNGEDWGLYLAVEGVEEAFLQRNYGSDYGELYKPDSMSFGGGRGNGKNFDITNFDFGSENENSADKASFGDFDPSSAENGEMPNIPFSNDGENIGNFDFSDIPDNFDPTEKFGDKVKNFGGGMGSSDVKLQYIDDELSSYSNIWNNAKTDITEADQKRLIQSLKKLSANEDIADTVDVEQVIRYFVVHNYVCNGDSYTGSMIHNYYLYEKDGRLSMLPWDYNLAFGTFQGGNADSAVNTPIDSPIDNGSGEDRPMWNWIVSNEEYTGLYHEYFEEFLAVSDIDSEIDRAYELIKEYVEKDPTAFYTAEEFEVGVETLRQFCTLRSESISLQLQNGETENNMNYVDASDITLSDMGSMGRGGDDRSNVPNRQGGTGGSDKAQTPENEKSSDETQSDSGKFFDDSNAAAGDAKLTFTLAIPSNQANTNGNTPPSMPDGAQPPDMPNMQGGDMPGQMPNGQGGGDMPSMPEESQAVPPTSDSETGSTQPSTESDSKEETTTADSETKADENKQKPNGNFSFDMNRKGLNSDTAAWIWIGISALVLALGLIVAKKYK